MSLLLPPSSHLTLLSTLVTKMTTSSGTLFLFLFMGVTLVLRTAAFPRCPLRVQTAEEVAHLRETCKYGIFEDNCSQIQCARGPEQSCGTANGMFRSAGLCGPGLRCACGRCMGCSSLVFPLECFDKTCNTPEVN